jgi:hypothetical protein
MAVQSCKRDAQPIPSVPQVSPVKQVDSLGTGMTGTLPAGTFEFITLVTSQTTPPTYKTLSVAGGSTASGALMVQELYDNYVQEWRVTNLGGGDYAIVNLNSGLALTLPDGKATENEQLDQATFSITNNAQRWKISYQAFGLYYIKTKLDTTKGINVAAGSVANGAKMQLNTLATNPSWGYFFIGSLSVSTTPITINTPDANHTNSYPRVTVLPSGNLLASFQQDTSTGYNHPVIEFYKSTNGGTTWTSISNLTDTQRGKGLWDATPYVTPVALGSLPAGTLLCAVRSAFWVSTSYIDIYKSTDNGVTWSYLSNVATGLGFGTNVYEPFLLVDSSGNLVCYYSDERNKATHSQKLSSQTSTDGGITWGAQTNVLALTPTNARPGMLRASKMGNGNWLMTYEYVNNPGPASGVYYKTSSDGDNWGAVSNAGTEIHGQDGSGPGATPSVIWTSAGSTNGTLIMICQFATTNNYVNFDYGAGVWSTVPQPLPYTSNSATGYSRSIAESANDKTLYQINCVAANGVNAKTEFVATPAW